MQIVLNPSGTNRTELHDVYNRALDEAEEPAGPTAASRTRLRHVIVSKYNFFGELAMNTPVPASPLNFRLRRRKLSHRFLEIFENFFHQCLRSFALSRIRRFLLPLEVEVRFVPRNDLGVRESPKLRGLLTAGTIISVVTTDEIREVVRANWILPE